MINDALQKKPAESGGHKFCGRSLAFRYMRTKISFPAEQKGQNGRPSTPNKVKKGSKNLSNGNNLQQYRKVRAAKPPVSAIDKKWQRRQIKYSTGYHSFQEENEIRWYMQASKNLLVVSYCHAASSSKAIEDMCVSCMVNCLQPTCFWDFGSNGRYEIVARFCVRLSVENCTTETYYCQWRLC